MTLRTRSAALASLAILCLVGTGCSSGDTGQTNVKFDPAQSQRDNQKRIQEIQNDPKIPESQKRMIIGRMQSGAASAGAPTQTGGKK